MDVGIVAEPPALPQVSQSVSPPFVDPIPASILADEESQRRNVAVGLGACATGCEAIDTELLLLGGFERASVVGISSEDEEMGTKFGLQTLTHSLCEGTVKSGLVITPKPANVMLKALRDSIKAELTRSNKSLDGLRDCLDKVMLSCVFDLDGLWEVLADLESRPRSDQSEVRDLEREDEGREGVEDEGQARNDEREEIADSQDDEDDLFDPTPKTTMATTTTTATKPREPGAEPEPEPGRKQISTSSSPEIILITHFSSLLTGLFTHREKSAAHSSLQLLSSQLGQLSRTLPSNPLILLLNSANSSTPSTESRKQNTTIDPTLRSIFNPPHVQGSGRRTKPSFGLVFTQLVDLHLLCTWIPRTRHDAELAAQRLVEGVRVVWVVEVLLDELGYWQGRGERRKDREQRWAAVDVQNGRIENAFLL